VERPTPKYRGLSAYYDLREVKEYLAAKEAEIAALKQEVENWKTVALRP
jgi:phage terminase Nu1 subunit (DNA packaging protein)